MSEETKKDAKKRTERDVRLEISAVEQELRKATEAATDGARRADYDARAKMLTGIGEVKKTFTDPEMARIRAERNSARQKAQQAHEAAIAAAHGAFEKATREQDAKFEADRDEISRAEKSKNEVHAQVYATASAAITAERDQKIAVAEQLAATKLGSLQEELKKLEKPVEKSEESNIPLTVEGEKKKSRRPKRQEVRE